MEGFNLPRSLALLSTGPITAWRRLTILVGGRSPWRSPPWQVANNGMESYNDGMESVVGEKGQVTIPKPLRDSLGLGPGVRLEFEEHDGVLCARKAEAPDPIGSLWGLLPPFDVDAEIEAARGPVWLPPVRTKGKKAGRR